MGDYSDAMEFLMSRAEPYQTLATLGKANLDEIVIAAEKLLKDPTRPLPGCVQIMAKNETFGSVLLQNRQGKFSEFPADFPCLRFNPPFIDGNWLCRPKNGPNRP